MNRILAMLASIILITASLAFMAAAQTDGDEPTGGHASADDESEADDDESTGGEDEGTGGENEGAGGESEADDDEGTGGDEDQAGEGGREPTAGESARGEDHSGSAAVERRSDQGDSEVGEEDSGLPTWRPRGGSMFGSSGPTFNRQDHAGELTERPLRPAEQEETDDRPEILVFDLYLGDGVRFEQRYMNRLEQALAGALESNEALRPLSPRERSRRLTQASQLVGDEVSDDYAESVAVAIEAEYYLIPRIVVENSRNYRVSATFGRAGTGESGRRVETRTSNRVVDNVERLVRDLTRAALATAGE